MAGLRVRRARLLNGKLRIVAIGASTRRVGVAEVTTDVKGDFILTPNVPATVSPGDEFIVSVGVFNNNGGANGPIHVEAQLSPGLSLVSPAGLDLQIAEKKEGSENSASRQTRPWALRRSFSQPVAARPKRMSKRRRACVRPRRFARN